MHLPFSDKEIAELCAFIAFGTAYARFGAALSVDIMMTPRLSKRPVVFPDCLGPIRVTTGYPLAASSNSFFIFLWNIEKSLNRAIPDSNSYFTQNS